jgi:hypothetical protein
MATMIFPFLAVVIVLVPSLSKTVAEGVSQLVYMRKGKFVRIRGEQMMLLLPNYEGRAL